MLVSWVHCSGWRTNLHAGQCTIRFVSDLSLGLDDLAWMVQAQGRLAWHPEHFQHIPFPSLEMTSYQGSVIDQAQDLLNKEDLILAEEEDAENSEWVLSERIAVKLASRINAELDRDLRRFSLKKEHKEFIMTKMLSQFGLEIA